MPRSTSLAADGLLDDAEFARSYVADKRRLAGWGTERIRRGLAAAGVGQADVDAALGAAAAGDPEDDELQRALEVLHRRAPKRPAARRCRAPPRLPTAARRGFASGVAYAAVRQWSAQLPYGEDDAEPDASSDETL